MPNVDCEPLAGAKDADGFGNAERSEMQTVATNYRSQRNVRIERRETTSDSLRETTATVEGKRE
jgi:hypothetical protein